MKSLLASSFLIAALFFGSSVNAQKFSELDKSPLDIAMYRGQDKAPRVRVIYSRPQKKGRDVFAKKDGLEKYGDVWRTGANESTEIKFYKDMIMENVSVNCYSFQL